MADTIRDSALGFLLRTATRGRLFGYPEDRPDFQLPDTYVALATEGGKHDATKSLTKEAMKAEEANNALKEEKKIQDEGEKKEGGQADEPEPVLSRVTTGATTTTTTTASTEEDVEGFHPIESVKTKDQHLNLHKVETTKDLERALTAATAKRTATRPIIPTKTADGIILVDWYDTDDQANPQNWSGGKKALVMVQICLYTMSVYMGSSIYTSSEPAIIEIFGVPQSVASLGLALYVLGYGTGPLLFSLRSARSQSLAGTRRTSRLFSSLSSSSFPRLL